MMPVEEPPVIADSPVEEPVKGEGQQDVATTSEPPPSFNNNNALSGSRPGSKLSRIEEEHEKEET